MGSLGLDLSNDNSDSDCSHADGPNSVKKNKVGRPPKIANILSTQNQGTFFRNHPKSGFEGKRKKSRGKVLRVGGQSNRIIRQK